MKLESIFIHSAISQILPESIRKDLDLLTEFSIENGQIISRAPIHVAHNRDRTVVVPRPRILGDITLDIEAMILRLASKLKAETAASETARMAREDAIAARDAAWEGKATPDGNFRIAHGDVVDRYGNYMPISLPSDPETTFESFCKSLAEFRPEDFIE